MRDYADEHPDREWILGGGWSMDLFPGGTPTKDLLDSIVPERPVYLPNRDGHSGWVNSRALELAGITADTRIPPAAGSSGTPTERTGAFHEGAADLVGSLAPVPSPDDVHRAVLEGQRYLHGLGITAWQDAAVSASDWGDNYSAYRRAPSAGS